MAAQALAHGGETGRRPRLKSAALLALCLATQAQAQLSGADRAALADLGPQFAQRYELKRGWFRNQPVLYFDIGPQENTTAAVFLFISGFRRDGTPVLVPGQRPVFSSLPGLPGFSAIWQVHLLRVPPGYVPNSVRDARQALAMALSSQATLVLPGTYINYSIVPDGSSLFTDPDARPLLRGWFKGAEVPYFDFGYTERLPAPIHPFVTGFDGDAPLFLRAQANVVDRVPGAGTHDLWDVMFTIVPASYEPDTVRDLATLLARQDFRVRPAGQVRNCPVVIVNGVRAIRPTIR